MGALIDIERSGGHADSICIETIRRAISQLAAVERICESCRVHHQHR
jgi:hypothetical protein